MSDPDAIATLVFFDLETTGLPQFEFNRTKITELTLVACSVEHISSASPSQQRQQRALPRVLHKLSVCTNPFRMIQPESSKLTGLDNFMLEHEEKFTANTGALLVHFVRQLRQPVCLVAHNGSDFDFRLLKRELERVQVELPDNVRCVDSLAIFRRIDEIEAIARHESGGNSNDAAESDSEAEHEKTPAKGDRSRGDLLVDIVARDSHIDWRKLNETTPHRKRGTIYPAAAAPPVVARRNDDANGNSSSSSSSSSTKRKLFDAAAPSSSQQQPVKRFRLGDIYERLFDVQPPQAHCAEADALALLRCVCAARVPFLALVDGAAGRFADVLALGQMHARRVVLESSNQE